MTSSVELAAAAVRLWTRLYTWRMANAARDERRALIESDLWEFQHDPLMAGGLGAAMHLVSRALLGIAHDLLWRVEQATQPSHVSKVAGVVSIAVLVVVAAVAIIDVSMVVPPRVPPAPAPSVQPVDEVPPPPPPPEMQGGRSDRDYWKPKGGR